VAESKSAELAPQIAAQLVTNARLERELDEWREKLSAVQLENATINGRLSAIQSQPSALSPYPKG
jgi:septal ring factor EnvC (AmiA/AmiB activator)